MHPLDLKKSHICLPVAISCQAGPERLIPSLSPSSRKILASSAGIMREARLGHKKGP